jgi:hypothetical protein
MSVAAWEVSWIPGALAGRNCGALSCPVPAAAAAVAAAAAGAGAAVGADADALVLAE